MSCSVYVIGIFSNYIKREFYIGDKIGIPNFQSTFSLVISLCLTDNVMFIFTNFLRTWVYLAVPIIGYRCERLIRALRSSIKFVKTLKCDVYPSILGNVVALYMSKPQGFICKNCVAVSPFEW